MSARKANSGATLETIRAAEIQRLLLQRYGITLLDTAAARVDLWILLRHLAHLPRGDKRMANYVDLYAPWLVGRERDAFLQEAMRSQPLRLKADTLAFRLGVTDAERTACRIRTIGAVDLLKAGRLKRRREADRKRQTKRRLRSGHKPRSIYLATSAAQQKPWEAAGISKRTWYRRKARDLSGTSPSAITLLITA